MNTKPTKTRDFALRAFVLGVVLIVLDGFWIVAVENRIVWELTDFSLFPTVLFSLFVIASFNLFLKRFVKSLALSEAELAVLYIMASIGTALAGHDMIRQLVPMIGNAFWFATPENEWADLFFRYIPDWLTVSDKRVLEEYYQGGSSFWNSRYIHAWAIPVLAWTAFIVVLLFVMLCINIIIRKQWIEHEKLSYPIIALPLEMISNTSGLLRNRLMWLGFGIAFAIEILAGIHFLYPAIPAINLKFRAGLLFTEKPWNAMGSLPIYIYGFAIGLGYLMPLDLSLSLWFFYLFWKLQLVASSVIGLRTSGGWQGEQRVGAWIAIGLLALWTSRRHIKQALAKALALREDDAMYRFAVLGVILGMAFILIFWYRAGFSPWAALLYFSIYLLLTLAITRMRAELGPPTHELHNMHPDYIMVSFMGTRKFGPSNLTSSTLLAWLAYGYRCHPMPHQLEGFKIASTLKMNEKRLVGAMILAAVVGTFVSISAHLILYYKYRFALWGTGPFYRLQGWLTFPTTANTAVISQIGFGFGLTVLFTVLKRQFLWWPFYPVGYAVGSGWAISWMWFSIFLDWLSKRLLLSLGGLKAHRNAMPFFFGLILGQFLAGSLWSLIGLVLEKRVYTMFP